MHATMNIYNAFCDRVPVIVVAGNDLDAAHRPPGVPTIHSAQDINAIVREFTKWDDTPVSAQPLCPVFRARLSDRGDAALRAGCDFARRWIGDRAGPRLRAETLHSEIRGDGGAQGESGAVREAGASSSQCRASGDRRRPRGEHAEGHRSPGPARRIVAGAGGAPARAGSISPTRIIWDGRRA